MPRIVRYYSEQRYVGTGNVRYPGGYAPAGWRKEIFERAEGGELAFIEVEKLNTFEVPENVIEGQFYPIDQVA